MRKTILIILSIFLINFPVFAQEILKAGIEEYNIPKGFFGSWAVISKLKASNNPTFFNYESRDIWALSAVGNKLILENTQSGAYSEIFVNEKVKDGKTLKFEREKTVNNKDGKIVYKEKVEFVLVKDTFTGTDIYTTEKYNHSHKLIESNYAKYVVSAVKISGYK